jgi:hypothetical protein
MTQGPSSSSRLGSNVPRRDNVLILGLRKAGKSSSFQVVYESLNPEDALQEGVTQAHKSEPYEVDTFHCMRIWDGTNNFNTSSPANGKKSGGGAGGPEIGGRPSGGDGDNSATTNAKGKVAFGTAGQLYWTECSAIIFVVDSQVSASTKSRHFYLC